MPFGACCGPLWSCDKAAATAEQLMRSRYSAFATGAAGYLLNTWHPTTRPASLNLDEDIEWSRLIINDVVAGSLFDDHGVVEFTALYTYPDPDNPAEPAARRRGRQHERSTFRRENKRWYYVDGIL